MSSPCRATVPLRILMKKKKKNRAPLPVIDIFRKCTGAYFRPPGATVLVQHGAQCPRIKQYIYASACSSLWGIGTPIPHVQYKKVVATQKRAPSLLLSANCCSMAVSDFS